MGERVSRDKTKREGRKKTKKGKGIVENRGKQN
jgi:hypothetical protein